MKNIYPDMKRLFEETGNRGRKLSYTPRQIIEEFGEYVKSLAESPIELVTEYKGGKNPGTKTERFSRPPKVTDFVVRWLGKSMSWWANIEQSKRNGNEFLNIKDKITQYCYDCKMDGAIVGIYNANIIARDLGLQEKVAVEKRPPDPIENMTLEEVNAEIERLGMKPKGIDETD